MSQCKMDRRVWMIVPLNRAGRVKSSFKPVSFLAGVLAFALMGVSFQPVLAADSMPGEATGPRMGKPPSEPETQVIRLRAGQLPYVTLTGDIFFRVMAAEIAAQRGLYDSAATTLLSLSQETGDPRLARRALEFQLASGNLRGALDSARTWARQSPSDIEASSTELALAAANGETAGLAAALRKRIDASPNKPAAIAQALGVLSRLNDRRLALRILDESFSPAVRNLPDAHMALADVAQAAGDDARAVAEARLALKADPDSEAAALRVLEYGARVDRSLAVSETRAFLTKHPDARKLHLSLAGMLADSGDYDTSLAELKVMARRAPEDFDLLYLQAQVAYKAGHKDQARALLQQYLDVQNQRLDSIAEGATDAVAAEADARILLSRIAEDLGQYDEAVAQLEQIDDPTLRYSAQMRQAALRAKQGRVDEAIAMVDAARPNDEDDEIQGILTKSQILRDADRIDEAVRSLEAANQAQPDTIEIKYELAMLYERQARYKELEAQLRQVIALDPDHAHAFNALGYTLADRNERLPEALDLITQALELLPDNPFILDSMGWVKFRMGDLQAAADYLSRAYAQRPEADIAAHLAEVWWMQGKRDQATELLQATFKQNPTNRTLLDTAKRLGVTFEEVK